MKICDVFKSTIYQVNSTVFYLLAPEYQVGLIGKRHRPIFTAIYQVQEKEGEGMERGDQFTKKKEPKSFSKGFFRFIEKGFDWIALVVIALIILFVLVFFSV